VLADRAQEILKLPVQRTAGSDRQGFTLHRITTRGHAERCMGRIRWRTLESEYTPVIVLVPERSRDGDTVADLRNVGRITETDPPVLDDGNALIRLDPAGHLRSLADRARLLRYALRRMGRWTGIRFSPRPARHDALRTGAAADIPRTTPRNAVPGAGTLAGNPADTLLGAAAQPRGRPVQFRILRAWETAPAPSIEQPTTVRRSTRSCRPS